MARAPAFFVKLLVEFLETTPAFADKLWRAYPASQTLIFQLGLCNERTTNLVERVRRLSELLPGYSLIYASVGVAPENGRPRPPEAVAFEEAVLQRLHGDGSWKWYPDEGKDG
jgi:hypothetical protein